MSTTKTISARITKDEYYTFLEKASASKQSLGSWFVEQLRHKLNPEPDPNLIDSMAMRYRHDFGLLSKEQQDTIRTTMKQIWEEVVGLGFYKKEKTK